MFFVFPPAIQAGLAAGQFVQVISKSGIPLSIAREVATGRFVGHAIGVAGLNPLTGFPNFILDGYNAWQIGRIFNQGQQTFQAVDALSKSVNLLHLTGIPSLVLDGYNAWQAGRILDQGRQTIQAVNALAQSVTILQATTAVIGVGVAATAALSAVNLYHTLKLRQDVAALRLEVREGFLDLKQALQDQSLELIQHIDRVAEDVEFRQHRTILATAYGRFKQAISQLQLALTIQDLARRNAELQSARNMMFHALADYDNPQLLTNMNAAAYIRRRECVWAIQQAIALTYQLQGDLASVNHQLQSLTSTIRQDALVAIEQIKSQAEQDFLFPELIRIHDHDLQTLTLWEAQTDWLLTLPPDEIQLLSSSELSPLDLQLPESGYEWEGEPEDEVLPEQRLYEELQQKSNTTTLRDQLRLMMNPAQRLEYATVISQRAQNSGLTALTIDNLQATSDYAIANLYHYFQVEAI